MVVSETGARLSPKAAPDMMIPASRAGWHPNSTPAGYRTPMAAAMVPKPVPLAVANRQDARKVMTRNAVLPTPSPAA